ncbi:SDR family NAD(P)-dependent oxidoreductase [Pseudaestuariivita rosea]|uniref:SDR family NAD(P)-dependent oxidoreductase n=1 Tax=Pseudaestuariivita rosea TaxID=2763263 RepID=UPI001ABB1565|nr:SDR family NAD(P)-dependent oxidoreductase [Pseudaestuariivita rosea]
MTVLITGANRGIGLALFNAYKDRGEAVHGTSRAPVTEENWHQLEVTDPASHAKMCKELDCQPIDLLICNAGVYLDQSENLADGYPPQMWADTFAVNVTGVFLTIQTLLPNLQMASGAKIAIISSQMASHTRAPGGSYIYRSSKAAVLNLGRNLATDMKHIGIAVGIYHPGWVRTDMGGDQAELGVTEAAAGLVERFAHLSLETTGIFETWDGHAHAY